MARRFECVWRDRADGGRHLVGNGTPSRRKCYCGGELRIEEGKWGVFAWDPENRAYRPEDVVTSGLFERKAAADRCADRLSDEEIIGGGYVVRWLPDRWLVGQA